MRELVSRLFPLNAYTDPLQRRRALGTYLVAALILAGVALGALNGLLALLQGGSVTGLPLALLQGGVLVGAALGGMLLTRRRQQTFGALTIVTAWFVVFFILTLVNQITPIAGYAGVLVGVSLGTLLVGEGIVAYMVGIAGIFVLFGASINPANARELLIVGLSLLVVHASVNYTLAQSFRTIARQVASDVETRGLRLAGVSGALAQRLLAARLDLNALLAETVRLVHDTFPGADEVQLYLVDRERKNATLVATTAPHAVALGQQVGVGSLNVIGRVTIGGQTVLVRDSGEEQPYRLSAFLEGTRAELVIPLHVGNETIGALDVQSRRIDAFTPEDTEALETLANLIAVAIDNARLFEEAQAKLAENQRLYEQTSASLREIERLNQQLTGGAWSEYLRGLNRLPAYTIDPGTGRIEDAAEWTSTLSEASRRNQTIMRTGTQTRTIALPIAVRGEVIGAMEFEIAPDQVIGQEQMAILQQVVERLGLAAENMRLLDEAQRIAQREAMVNEITARMQAATNVEAVVAAATQSLSDAFQASRVAIRLGTPGSSPGDGGAA